MMNPRSRARLYAALAACLLASGHDSSAASSAPAAGRIVATETRVVGGQTYTLTKIMDAKGGVRSQITDGSGKVVDEAEISRGVTPLADPRVSAALAKLESAEPTAQTLRVEIALRLPADLDPETPEMASFEMERGRWVKGHLNGREISEADMAAHVDRSGQEERAARARRKALRAQSLQSWASRFGLSGQKGLDAALRQGRSGATLDLTARQLRSLIDSRDPMLAGIGLHESAKDDIADAMDATSITPTALDNALTRGNGIGIYMTETGCPDESHIANYDRLSGSETDHSKNVSAILREVSPESYIYCRGDVVLPDDSDLDGANGNPPIHIVTQSAGTNYTDEYDAHDRDWDNFAYDNNIAMFKSAGNEGEGTGDVGSPGKALNVITVGNYDDATATINGTSSYADPETGNDKPEIVAPGTSVDAGGFSYTGTSQAAPHAAAFAADVMSRKTLHRYRPWLVKATMLASATDPIDDGDGDSEGLSDKAGLGGIDFADGFFHGFAATWKGGTRGFDNFDAADGVADGTVVVAVPVSDAWDRVRVALSWLTRGDHTYDHRADLYPLGLDLDLRVFDPNGSLVGGSWDWNNPFEHFTFEPEVSGIYTVKIDRRTNTDPDLKLRMALSVNRFDQ